VRVVAGRLRSRRLRALPGNVTRPTTDRARGGLFDWIGPRVEGAIILDLFAGTGALGIEALSRGATRATFVESGPRPCAVLRHNLGTLELEGQAEVLARDALRAIAVLARRGARFDLVFADPPYGSDWCERLLRTPCLPELMPVGGELYLERSAREPPPPGVAALPFRDARAWGDARFHCYERTEAPTP
jgi:16S rRNA (guanine(966)-N(2))-methyltransferase RsmD